MVDTFSPLNRYRLPEVGAKEDLWAPPVSAGLNDGVADMIDESIAGTVFVDMDPGNITLTKSDGVTDNHRPIVLRLGGIGVVARDLIVPDPPTAQFYYISNGRVVPTTFKTVSGTGTVLEAGRDRLCYVDPVADDCFQIDFTEDIVLLQGAMISYLADIENATAGDTQVTIRAINQGSWAMVQIPSFSSTITPGGTFNRFRLLPNTPATFDGAGLGAVSPTPPAQENIYALTAGVSARWNIQGPREGVSDFFDVMVTDSVLIANGTVITVPHNVIMTYYTA